MCGCQAFPMIRSGFKQLPLFVAVQENKDTLKGGLDAMDHTMPFFSPAATSTVGRPGKVPPPVPPKMNSSFDDSFSKTDVVSTPQGSPLTFVCVANYCCIQCKRRCFFCVVCAAEVWKLTTGEAVPLLTKKEKVLSWCTKFMQGWKMTGANRCPEQVIVLQCPRLHHSRVQKEALAAHPPEPVRSILKEKDATVFASWSTESACKNRQCDNTSVRIIFGEHPMSRIVFPWQKPISGRLLVYWTRHGTQYYPSIPRDLCMCLTSKTFWGERWVYAALVLAIVCLFWCIEAVYWYEYTLPQGFRHDHTLFLECIFITQTHALCSDVLAVSPGFWEGFSLAVNFRTKAAMWRDDAWWLHFTGRIVASSF